MKIFLGVIVSLALTSCPLKNANDLKDPNTTPSDDLPTRQSNVKSPPPSESEPDIPVEMVFPDKDSLHAFLSGNSLLEGRVVDNFSDNDAILNSYEISPSEMILEGKDGVIPRMIIELCDKEGKGEADSFIFNAWYETSRRDEPPSVNRYNFISKGYSYLTDRNDTGGSHPVLQQVIYAPQGIQKQLFSHFLYRFFRETEDLGVFLENNQYDIKGPYILSEYASYFAAAKPDLPTISAEDFQTAFNAVFGSAITVYDAKKDILRFEGGEGQFAFHLEKETLTGEITPLTIAFKETNKESAFGSVAEMWNHSMPTPKIIKVCHLPDKEGELCVRLPVSPFLTAQDLRLVLQEAKKEWEDIKLLVGDTGSSSGDRVIHPDLDEVAAFFTGSKLDASIVDAKTIEGDSINVVMIQPAASLMKEDPPYLYLWQEDSLYDEDTIPDSLILKGFSSPVDGTVSLTEQDAVWASFWNDKKAARISRSIFSSNPSLSMKIHMPEGLEEGAFQQYLILFFDELAAFAEESSALPLNLKDLLSPSDYKPENHPVNDIKKYLKTAFNGTFQEESYFDGGYQFSCALHPELRVYSSADQLGRQRWLEVYADFEGKEIEYGIMDKWNRGTLEHQPLSIMTQHPQSREQPELKAYISLDSQADTITAALKEFNKEKQTVQRDY